MKGCRRLRLVTNQLMALKLTYILRTAGGYLNGGYFCMPHQAVPD